MVKGASTGMNLASILQPTGPIEAEIAGAFGVARISHPLGLNKDDHCYNGIAYCEDAPHDTHSLGIAGVLVVVCSGCVLILHLHD